MPPRCSTGQDGQKKVTLELSVTASVSDDRVAQPLRGDEIPIWEIQGSRFGASELRNKADLTEYRELVDKTLDAIKNQHGMEVDLSVFPAIPAACAISFGRTWQPKAHPSFTIYDQIAGQGFSLRHSIR
ncbi:SAVED domain-containing protein [Phaeovulum sp.]|uniref:SAVED domain-containing protein n=1 Tax=Phaeovulum sp. TaxID=2934796 RepID=UPI0039E622AB